MFKKEDVVGTPVFVFERTDGGLQFYPRDLSTIHEYIKAIQESQEEKPKDDKYRCGAV